LNTPNTPAELAALQDLTVTPGEDTLNGETVLDALLSLPASEAKVVLLEALTKLRDFHSSVAHEAVEEGRENWFAWTVDASKLNTCVDLLESVQLD
jgi:hypothetical protein